MQAAQRTPLVTFIIPCFNTCNEHLQQCLKSITSEALADISCEIIVVDDGSQQMPQQTLDEFAESITVIHQPHEGVSAARNAGMEKASGEYIQFVDADDYIDGELFGRLIKQVQQYQYDILVYGRQGKSEEAVNIAVRSGVAHMCRHNLNGAVWNCIFRRSLTAATSQQEALRFTPGVAYAEDEEFTALLMLRAKHMGVMDRHSPYHYRRHQLSATGNRTTTTLQRRFDDTLHVIRRLRQEATTMQGKTRQALTRRVAQLTMDYLYNVITLTQSRRQLEQHVTMLRANNLFPLPFKYYTLKYTLFSLTSRCKAGRRLLMRQCVRHHDAQQTT